MNWIDPSCRERRADEARYESLCYRLEEEAENAERQARLADEEADRLEREAGPINQGGWGGNGNGGGFGGNDGGGGQFGGNWGGHPQPDEIPFP